MNRDLTGSRKRGRGHFKAPTIFLVFVAVFLFGALPASAVILDNSPAKDFESAVVLKRQVSTNALDLIGSSSLREKKSEKKYKEDEILVKFKSEVPEISKEKLHKRHGSAKIKELLSLHVHHIKLRKGLTVAEAIKLYKSDPDVEYAEPNFIVNIAETIPSDPYFSSTGTWGQSYPDMWGLHKIQSSSAWDITKGSADVIVAVSDTGLDFTHPDIQGNIRVNTGEIPGNGIDDDANGYVDDVNGWDFSTCTKWNGIFGFCEIPKLPDNDPTDDHGHGTHVSGTISAAANNGIGIPGVSWFSKIMPVKFLGPDGYGSSEEGAASIVYAADNGARVINCSWGGPQSQVVEDAINYAFQKGVVVVAAAGNNGGLASLSSPAGCENVMTVAATDYQDKKAWFSNYGPAVEVSAPGVDILSLRAGGTNMGSPVGTDYARANGTSMAAPHVSGLAAILFAQNPSWPANQVIGQIIGTTDDIGDSSIGSGRINALSALTRTPSAFIRYMGRKLDDTSGNGDGQINPGETVRISVTFKNITGFASGVTATLSTTDPYVTILQDSASFGDLNAWSTADNESSPYIVSIAPDAPKIHKIVFTLTVSANGGAYSFSESLEERVSLHLAGWPLKTEAAAINSPALADIDNDGLPEVIIASDKIYVIKGDGTFAAGWPQDRPDDFDGLNSVAAGDLDKDGKLEIVSAGVAKISAWRADGTSMPGFSVPPDGAPGLKEVSISDLDGDGDLEIISTSPTQGKAYAWHHDGTAAGGWPVTLAKTSNQYNLEMHQCVGDIDGDGKMEVIVPTMEMRVFALNHDGTIVAGWPKAFDVLYCGLADINNDGKDEIFIGAVDGQLYGIYGNGSLIPGWPQPGVAPVFGDIDGDGVLEIVTSTGGISVYHKDGTMLQGWPQPVASQGHPPVLGDIDGDGRIDVVMRDSMDHIYAWNANGIPFSEFPITMSRETLYDPFALTSLALGDINGDGLIDMITGSGTLDTNVYAYTLTGAYAAQNVPWSMYLHDSRRSANLNNPFIVTTSLPGGTANTPYSYILQAKGGSLPYSWSIVSGTLPPGLQLDQKTGEISGTPTVGGIFKFTVQVVDAAFMKAVKSFSLTIAGAAPDMIISALTAPSTAGAGMAITINDTTKNNGQIAAAASITRFYLSTNATLDSSDVELGSRAVPALAAGEEHTGTISAAIPDGTPTRTMYIIARADDGNSVPELYETNNTLYRAIAIGPDLSVASLTVPAGAGAGMSIIIADSAKNNGGGDAGPSTTRFYLSINTVLDSDDRLLGGRDIPALAGGESSSGETTVTIPPDTLPITYYIIAKADSDAQVEETNETNNIRVSTAMKIGPDLTISALSLPSIAGAGASITIADTTKNGGGGDAGATTTAFYFTSVPIIDSRAVLLGSRSAGPLPAGAVSQGSTIVTIPAETKTGSYYIIARSDDGNTANEFREDNNTLYRSITVGPDLAVSAITVPTSAGAGKTILVSDTTRNNGPGAVPESKTYFYLSMNTTFDSTARLIGSRTVPALAGGESSSGETSVTIPSDARSQAHYIIAKADGDDLIAELYETNNLRTSSAIKIGPDLSVSVLTVPSSSGAGKSITITDTTKNIGAGDAGPSTTKYYLSFDTAFDMYDKLLGGRPVDALAAGASSAGTATVTIPADTVTGSYYIIAKADGDDVVAEILETNNTRYSTGIRIGPDLTVSALTVPSVAGAGLSISVTDTTKNSGAGDADASVTVFYLSADTTLDAADVQFGSRSVPALAAGAGSQVTTSLTIPEDTVGGLYYIISKADGDGLIPEITETNNTRYSTSIKIGPDFTISALTVPTSAKIGAAISVTDTTKNSGAGDAALSTTSFYLSTDATLDSSDTLIGSRSVPALAPGGTSQASTSLTIPADTVTGTYYVIAKADSDHTIPETSETNNASYRTVAVGP